MKNAFLYKVLIAFVLAVCAGLLTGSDAKIFDILWIRVFDLIGQLFLNGLKLVVVPLVVSSIITGTARIGKEKAFGALGFRTFFFFILTSFIAVLVGVILVISISPGSSFDPSSMANVTGIGSLEEFGKQAQGGMFERVEDILFRLIPSNIFHVAAQGQMLGLILFSVAFGFFISRIEADLFTTMTNFWDGAFQIMMKMTHLVMRTLPFGVFGLMAKVVATTGLEAIKPIAFFFVTVILGLAIYMFIILPLLLKFVARTSPIQHFHHVTPALITAFSTSSTAATLPITIDCMEKRAGIPNRICSFTLSLGTSINLTGTALYAAISVIFIAQAYGMEMTFPTLFTIVLMCLFTALGMVAGIPSGSIISIVVILQTIGLPPDGIALIFAVERILDMCRTTVSVFGNTCCTSLVYGGKERLFRS